MSNYTKATDFASKDALLLGDPLKIVSGTELNDEFNAIQTANNTKANTNSPVLTGAPSAPTAGAGTNSTQLANTAFVTVAVDSHEVIVAAAILAAIDAVWPIGTIYTNAVDATNPATLLGFGVWSAFGAGRVSVGLDAGNTNFDTAEETGGSADAVVVAHSHDITDPGHVHNVSGTTDAKQQDDRNGDENTKLGVQIDTLSSVTGITIDSEGVDGTDLNLQPFITVYQWKRTA